MTPPVRETARPGPAPDTKPPGLPPPIVRPASAVERRSTEPSAPGPGARLSVLWWALGLTPTARLRRRRYREALADGRGARFAVENARRVS